MGSDLERDWERLEPPPEATERARRAVVEAARGRRPRWSRWSRRGGLAAVAAALVAAGAATAGVVRPWEQPARAAPTADPRVANRILADPLLSTLSWVVQPVGSPHIAQVGPRGSITFPPGYDYREAATILYSTVLRTGTLPPQATLGPPLPTGKIARYPASPRQGITLDLQAPFGYGIPDGRIRTPSFQVLGKRHPLEIARRARLERLGIPLVGLGLRIDTGHITPCQLILPGKPTPRCRVNPPPPDPWEGPPGAPAVAVPDVRGASAGGAAQALAKAGLRVFVMQVFTPEAARAAGMDRLGTVSLDVVRDAAAWRKDVGIVVIDQGESHRAGEILDLYPAPRARVRRGVRVVVAALADDCIAGGVYLQANCIPGAEAVRDASPELRDAPWLYSRVIGNRSGPYSLRNTRERPSLQFPPGVTRAQALGRLYVEAVLNGRLPTAARLAPPLPQGIVYARATRGAGIRIDLRAPFGYGPRNGLIYSMGVSFRADLRPEEIARRVRAGRLILLPTPIEDQVLPILPLDRCQVAGAPSPCPAVRRP